VSSLVDHDPARPAPARPVELQVSRSATHRIVAQSEPYAIRHKPTLASHGSSRSGPRDPLGPDPAQPVQVWVLGPPAPQNVAQTELIAIGYKPSYSCPEPSAWRAVESGLGPRCVGQPRPSPDPCPSLRPRVCDDGHRYQERGCPTFGLASPCSGDAIIYSRGRMAAPVLPPGREPGPKCGAESPSRKGLPPLGVDVLDWDSDPALGAPPPMTRGAIGPARASPSRRAWSR